MFCLLVSVQVPEEEARIEHQIPWNWISWMTVWGRMGSKFGSL